MAHKHKSACSFTQENRAAVIHYRHKLQDVIETVLTGVQKMKTTQLKKGENDSEWNFPVPLCCCEKRVFTFSGSSLVLETWWRRWRRPSPLTAWSSGLCLCDLWPSLLLHFTSVSPALLPCRHAISPPELKDSAPPWMSLSWERWRQEMPKSNRESSAEQERWNRLGKRLVFSCWQSVLLKYTPKQPEAHSSRSQWLTWQSAWQPLCTPENPLLLYSRPVLSGPPTSPTHLLTTLHPPHPVSHPAVSHAKKHLATCNQTFSSCQVVLLRCQWFWEQHGFIKLARKYCSLTLNVLSINNMLQEPSVWKNNYWNVAKRRKMDEETLSLVLVQN